MTDTEILNYLQVCVKTAPHPTKYDLVFGTLFTTIGRGDDIRSRLQAAIDRDEPNRASRVAAALSRS